MWSPLAHLSDDVSSFVKSVSGSVKVTVPPPSKKRGRNQKPQQRRAHIMLPTSPVALPAAALPFPYSAPVQPAAPDMMVQQQHPEPPRAASSPRHRLQGEVGSPTSAAASVAMLEAVYEEALAAAATASASVFQRSAAGSSLAPPPPPAAAPAFLPAPGGYMAPAGPGGRQAPVFSPPAAFRASGASGFHSHLHNSNETGASPFSSAGPAKPSPLPSRGGAGASPAGAGGLHPRSASPPHEHGMYRGLPSTQGSPFQQHHPQQRPGRAASVPAAAAGAPPQVPWRSPAARTSPAATKQAPAPRANNVPHYARPLGRFDSDIAGAVEEGASVADAFEVSAGSKKAEGASQARAKAAAAKGSRPSGVTAALAIKSLRPGTADAAPVASPGPRPALKVRGGAGHLPHSALSPLYGKEHARLPLYGGPDADVLPAPRSKPHPHAMVVGFKRVDSDSPPRVSFAPSVALPPAPPPPALPHPQLYAGGASARQSSSSSGRSASTSPGAGGRSASAAAARGMGSPSPSSGGVPDTRPPALTGTGASGPFPAGAHSGGGHFYAPVSPPPRQPMRPQQPFPSPTGGLPTGGGQPAAPAAPALAPPAPAPAPAQPVAPAPQPAQLPPNPSTGGPAIAFTSPLGATIVNPQVLAAAVADLQAQLSHPGSNFRSTSPLSRHEFGAVANSSSTRAIPTVSLLRVAGLGGGAGATGVSVPEAAPASPAPGTPFSATAVSSYLSSRSPGAGPVGTAGAAMPAVPGFAAHTSAAASVGDLHDAATRLVAGLAEEMQEQLANLAPFGRFLVDQARAGVASGALPGPGAASLAAGGPTDIAQLVEVLKALAVVHHGEAAAGAGVAPPGRPSAPSSPATAAVFASSSAHAVPQEAVQQHHILVSAHAAEHGGYAPQMLPPPPPPAAPPAPSTATAAATLYGFGTPGAASAAHAQSPKPPSPSQPPPPALLAAATQGHASAASPFASAPTASSAALAPLRAFKEGLSAAAAASPSAALRGVVSGTNVETVPLASVLKPGETVGALLGDLHNHVATVTGGSRSTSPSTGTPRAAHVRPAESVRASLAAGLGRPSASTPSFKAAAAALGLPEKTPSPSRAPEPGEAASPRSRSTSPSSSPSAAALASAAAARLSLGAPAARTSASLSPEGVAAPAPAASAAPFYSMLAAVDAGSSSSGSSAAPSSSYAAPSPLPPSRAGAATPSMESPTGPVAGHLARLADLIHKTSGGAAPLFMAPQSEQPSSAASYLSGSASSSDAPAAAALGAKDEPALSYTGPGSFSETLAALRSSYTLPATASILPSSPAPAATAPLVASPALTASTSGLNLVPPPKSALAAAVATSSSTGIMPLPPGPSLPKLAPASPAAASLVASVSDVRTAISAAFRDIAAEIMADSEALLTDVRSEVVDILAQGAEMETLVHESRTAYEGARTANPSSGGGVAKASEALTPGGAKLSSTLYGSFASAASTTGGGGGLATASPVSNFGAYSSVVASPQAPTSTSALLSQLRGGGGGGFPSFE